MGEINARNKLILLGCVGLLAVTLESPVSLILLVAIVLVPLLWTPMPSSWRRKGALAVVAAIWGTVLSQAIFYADEPRIALLQLGPLAIYKEGIVHGLVQSLRFVAITLAGVSVAVTTPPDRLFSGLTRLRIPYALAFLAVTAVRFVPLVATEWAVVRRARARRGRPVHHRAPWAWMALEIAMLRPVVARSLRRARALAESLETRGFDPSGPRIAVATTDEKPLQNAFLVGAVTLTCAAVGLRVVMILYTVDLAYFPQLRPVYGFVRHWL